MMVGEVDKRDTADAVKRFSPGVERCCGVIFDREKAYTALK
jgi:hypothetical protein